MRSNPLPLVLLLLLLGAVTAFGATPGVYRLMVVYTNDIHGGIDERAATFLNPEFPPIMGGIASWQPYIKRLRQMAADSGWGFLLMDDGDCFSGTPIGTLSKGDAVVQAYNLLGIDAVNIGNHDFDAGWENLKNLAKEAKFTFLGANVIQKSTGKVVDFLKPTFVKETGGVKIGVVGVVTTSTLRMSLPENVKDIDFLSEVDVVNETAKELHKSGVPIVLTWVHLGIPFEANRMYQKLLVDEKAGTLPKKDVDAMQLAHQVKDVDAVFGGHVHMGYKEPWVDPNTHIPVFQNYANGGGLGTVLLEFALPDYQMLGWRPLNWDGELITLWEEQFPPDSAAGAFLDTMSAKYEKGLDQVIGNATAPFTRGDASSNFCGFLVCDAIREAAKADFSITNLGGVRAELPGGPITLRNVFITMPFDNAITLVKVPGKTLQAIVARLAKKYSGALISGGEVVYDPAKPEGEKITSFKIGGVPLDPNKEYIFALSDFLVYGYGIPEFQDLPKENFTDSYILIRDAMADYIRAHTPLTPKADGRWRTIR